MAIKLPREGHPVRELFDCSTVEQMTPTQYKLLPTVADAKVEAREQIKRTGVELLHLLTRGNDGQVLLVTFGRRAGWVVRWNFGRLAV